MIQLGLNHTVSDCFGDDLLRLLNGFETEFAHDVFQADLAVGNVDLFQTELDYGVLKPVHQSHVLISGEHFCICDEHLAEFFHLTLLDTVHYLQVWVKML